MNEKYFMFSYKFCTSTKSVTIITRANDWSNYTATLHKEEGRGVRVPFVCFQVQVLIKILLRLTRTRIGQYIYLVVVRFAACRFCRVPCMQCQKTTASRSVPGSKMIRSRRECSVTSCTCTFIRHMFN